MYLFVVPTVWFLRSYGSNGGGCVLDFYSGEMNIRGEQKNEKFKILYNQ